MQIKLSFLMLFTDELHLRESLQAVWNWGISSGSIHETVVVAQILWASNLDMDEKKYGASPEQGTWKFAPWTFQR